MKTHFIVLTVSKSFKKDQSIHSNAKYILEKLALRKLKGSLAGVIFVKKLENEILWIECRNAINKAG